MHIRLNRFRLLISTVALQAGCTLGPDYVRPEMPVPAEFKEAEGWKQAQPSDDRIPGEWWRLFGDSRLDTLEAQVDGANQSVLQAEAQYRQAQYWVQSSQSSLLPVAKLTASFNRFEAATGQNVAVAGVRNLFNQAVNIAWEPDLWGRVSREIESNIDIAQASAANLQALRLSIQATLADNYFQLKSLDEQKKILNETVESFAKTLKINQDSYQAGMLGKNDVAQAQAQLDSARAQAVAVDLHRAKLEHAIAVLLGKNPSELSLATMSLDNEPPPVPSVLPSELLERRPDIAAAERNVAAANAKIGVAKAAYFPTINLSATNGFQSTNADTLFTAARRYWSLGPAAAALTIFDGGRLNAQYKQAIADYDASVAAYRQTVLNGFQEVEDSLAATRVLAEQQQVLEQAAAAAEQALLLTQDRYRAGTISYLNVLASQTVALNNRLAAVQLRGQRFSNAVQLVKALGGGWQEGQLPTEDQVDGDRKWTEYLIFPVE